MTKKYLPNKDPMKRLAFRFLPKQKRVAFFVLLKNIKTCYASMPKNDSRREFVKNFSISLWNSLEDEFFMTADISDNTLWRWQDLWNKFFVDGYFSFTKVTCEPSSWTQLLKGWYNRVWVYEVLKLIKDFNLDNQPSCYATAFQGDFKKVKSSADFFGSLLKWNDLIYWHPEKLSLLDYSVPMPQQSHFEDEFNDADDFSEHGEF